MVTRRDPVERVLDAIVAVPVACAVAARLLVPIGRTRLERRVARDLDLIVRAARRGIGRGRGRVTAAERVDIPAGAPPTGPPEVQIARVPTATAAERVPEVVAREPEVLTDAALPIEGYDQLSARQVVDRLADLTADELGLIGAYEQVRRRRQTILQRIAQLT